MFNIVLIEPEIPQNTGNIARTCAVTNSRLHLVGPLGFSVDDRYLKRAGLDYWNLLDIRMYDNAQTFFEQNKGADMFFATKKSDCCYTDVTYPDNAYLVFGKETKGLSNDILQKYNDRLIRIPMIDGARCLNLSNSVAVVLYEAFRQHNFSGLSQQSH